MKSKSFNPLTKQYRLERSYNRKKWDIMPFNEDVYKAIVARNYHWNAYFREKPYKPYWWYQIKWFFQSLWLYKIFTKKSNGNSLTAKNVILGVIVGIIVWFITQFLLLPLF